ncbi:hypothetical protein N658DRAFT_512576 [Parathielavia hyrcaniae]|uniref:Zn(2)-C6 fungal-type domain-containing protein n=1 Tax=Parathielavia hyrcaniae TaxID=113614 RepID=A0AAN6QAX9_9PEZI|nr:hypothetical protein N658DRAFT_512576 [Parathielavia hyrcaniae]
MVGVPGKYKGCETCRLRRVKCDNTRPLCRKCLDGGRACAGYERETVFIVGTVEDQGRCSSHPPRRGVARSRSRGGRGKAVPARGMASSSTMGLASSSVTGMASLSGAGGVGRDGGAGLEFALREQLPLRPAWDSLVDVEWMGRRYRLRVAGLYTDLGGLGLMRGRAGGDGEGQGGGVFVSLPVYAPPPDVRPGQGQEVGVRARCLVHLGRPDEELGSGEEADGVCLFLYEHTSSYFSNQPHWQDPSANTNTIRGLGPEAFRSFPAHNFFVRVYRPVAIMSALLNRTPTYLSDPSWLTTPFATHPKSPLDHLLDSLSTFPALLARADHVLAQRHTLARRLTAQELLHTCLDVELNLARATQVLGGQQQQQPLFRFEAPSAAAPGEDGLPGEEKEEEAVAAAAAFPRLSFRSAHAALVMAHYWTALVVLYPTVWRLYFAAVLDPVVDVDAQQTQQQQQQQGIEMRWGSGHVGTGMGMGPMTGSSDVAVPGSRVLPVPVRLQALDPMRYSLARTREVSGNVCRAMDFLLAEGCVQPDLMWHMFRVVENLFREIGGMGMDMGLVVGHGGFELMWCEGFRERLVARGRKMREVVLGRRWVGVASF